MTNPKGGSGPQAVKTGGNNPIEDQRAALRSKIMGAKRERMTISLFGAEIEILHPSVGEVIDTSGSDPRSMVIQLLIQNAYVPGTQTKVFDDADLEGLLARPFGTEMRHVSNVLNEMMGITGKDVEEAKGNLGKSH